ncbi:MAG: phosphoribosylaminoimidazolesuccinocarboxamide synthase [Phycisphaerales bacterium]|nr:phosphoribosylaminoimidazolesuccinocarboxamide synthase [Phycisphaerales bacterium]
MQTRRPPSSPAPRVGAGAGTVYSTQLPLPGRRQGKVRDLYQLEPDREGPRLLVVATDRVSAFDVVMPSGIPGKGRMLTAMSAAWFGLLRSRGIVRDHVLSLEVPDIGIPDAVRACLEGRVMVCRAASVVPIECVARGYLAGSGWAEYRERGTVCGMPLPAGLRECDRLPEPIFSPATKADVGHDENISFDRACELVGGPLMERLRDLTLRIYRVAADHAASRGLLLADTKFEFGHALGPDGAPSDGLMLVDEVLTPDSSRYWPAEEYAPGRDQPSFDKQFLRNYLLGLVSKGLWRKEPPGPLLPAQVVEGTRARYLEALDRLFPGTPLPGT